MLKPEDIKKERQRFTEDNLSADNDSGMIIYDNKFSELKQVESKPYEPALRKNSRNVGNIYQYYAYSLAALIAGGDWGNGAACGARAVSCGHYPWDVTSIIGARGACDSL